MKIIQTSDVRLGAHFVGLKLAGDKLRAGLKSTFSRIIDYTINEKADLLIIAGNLFENTDVSKNLQDFVAHELSRLGSIPVVILPGNRDSSTDYTFWRSWDSLKSLKNVYISTDSKNPFIKLEELDCTVYGFHENLPDNSEHGDTKPTASQTTKYHIGVICCSPDNVKAKTEDISLNLDYICLGGSNSFIDLTDSGINAAYSGSPEKLDFDQPNAGNIAVVEIDSESKASVAKVDIGSFSWHSLEVKANEIFSNDDLMDKIKPLAGADTLLRLKLTGLALFESLLKPEYVQQLMDSEFLYLDIVDDMKVLPENISEVKVSEKTILGQYIKLMAQELNNSEKSSKPRLEKSLKIGYALLQGQELY